MRLCRRHPLFVPVALCACAVLLAGPTDAAEPRADAADGLSAEVVRLYEEAARATRRYEEGRREAERREAEVLRLERRLEQTRHDLAERREELGRIARAQYREGGGLPLAAQIVLADDAQDMWRGQRAFSQANLAVTNAVDKSRRAEERLERDRARAADAWHALERRNAELAALKREIEAKLEQARERLQSRADGAAAAGACRGAVRLDQPSRPGTGGYVAPLESYELSAGFGSGGARWANRHTGQDFAVPIGTPVRAVGDGRVVRVSCGGAFGIEVVLEHPGGYYTQYAHLAAAAVDQGERVAAGQWIGQSGTTGNSTGPHLHFEVRVTPEHGSGVDPVPWLAARGVTLGDTTEGTAGESAEAAAAEAAGP